MALLPKGSPMLYEDHRLSRCPPELRDKVANKLREIYLHPPWGVCAGMAAPQIGYPYNIFIAQGIVFENVVSIRGIGQLYPVIEGCFSIPHEPHGVKRYNSIRVTIGDKYTEYDGFLAQVIQHEFDHIRGKLINGEE